MKHTAKSVGLALAFPFRDLTEAQYYDGADAKPGMTFAAYLYSQNQSANVGNKLSSTDIKDNVK